MELGINTDFANEPWELEEIKNKLREIAEAGFTHIHWCFDWEKGVFQDNFRGVWGSINDRECYMELVYEGDD